VPHAARHGPPRVPRRAAGYGIMAPAVRPRRH
jgi:hypothetical protein